MASLLVLLLSCIINAATSRNRIAVIDINVDYQWTMRAQNLSTVHIEYGYIWHVFESMLTNSSLMPTPKNIADESQNKADIFYSAKDALNTTNLLSVQMEVEYRRKSELDEMQHYIERQQMNEELERKLYQLCSVWNILQVETSIEESSVDRTFYVMIVIVCLLTFGMLVTITCGVIYRCKRGSKQEPKEKRQTEFEEKMPTIWTGTPEQFVIDAQYEKDSEIDPFIDGLYAGYYCHSQEAQKFQLPEFMLRFEDDSAVKGWGQDSGGHFQIKGIFSHVTHRMCMEKTYLLKNDENDDAQNDSEVETGREHDQHAQVLNSMQIRLEFDEEEDQFHGEWIMKIKHNDRCGLWVISKVDQHETDDDYEEE